MYGLNISVNEFKLWYGEKSKQVFILKLAISKHMFAETVTRFVWLCHAQATELSLPHYKQCLSVPCFIVVGVS